METTELLKKVRAIELRTRGLSKQIFSGEYHSAFKGRGMAFSENREYQHGDEIRLIDWNVTARMGHPYVKIFEEERELTAMILVDVSASGNFGTRQQTKQQLITEITAVLAFSAIQNNDKIGVLFFSDKIERFIPPKKGRSHILRIIRELIDFKPESKGTDLSMALDYMNRVIKKRAICFLISDLQDRGFEKILKISSRKHDLIAIQTTDPAEEQLVGAGWMLLTDSETGEMQWVNTGSSKNKKALTAAFSEHQRWIKDTMTRSNVDHINVFTNKPYVQPLMQLFKQRGS
ncbi:MAG: DUF58 domain-containing protein [Flavobacteriales bacterium]|nr:DUF58 domain-containing protein [Flavobacteriales bacterium]MDG1781032.1 DUF58 domain-containing protein [Flavobacteriales bacterium]MDG2245788.1 DUF58 domain-containing protein [Flavobacteriales bacterium]